MTHPDEGTLQSWLDDELSSGHRAAVAGHLRECGGCRAALDRQAADVREAAAALALLDVPAPTGSAYRAVRSRRRRASRAALPWAAVFVLVAATALSAAVPGSPVRDWLRAALRPSPEAAPPAPPAPSASTPAGPAAAAPAPSPPTAAVAVRPDRGRLTVAIVDAAPGLRVRVHFAEEGGDGVRASGPAARAHFVTGPGRIEVRAPGAGEVEVAVPREAREFSLWVNGKPYLQSEGERMRLEGPVADTAGPEIRFEVPR